MNCPNCKKASVAEIFWGYPGNLSAIEAKLESKEMVLGGCIVSDHDPKWECNDCLFRWGEREN